MSKPNKTLPTGAAVADYLAAIASPERRADCEALGALMQAVTGEPPVMWGTAIVGFGRYHYRYASGREGECCLIGYASRKADISIYTNVGFEGLDADLLALGKHKVSGSCLHIQRMADIDPVVLQHLLQAVVAALKTRYAPLVGASPGRAA
jgi:hypothetical protein